MLQLWIRVDWGAMAMKGYSTFSKAPDCLVSYPGHFLGEGLTSLQTYNRCTLQPQPTMLFPCLIFWPSTRPKNAIPRWCTGRKWHIPMAVRRGNRVGGNWLTKWDEQKKFPWYILRLMHRKRVTCELHDSYFRLMTIKHSISKIEWAIV